MSVHNNSTEKEEKSGVKRKVSLAFPSILSSLRRERGMSQRQAASDLGISQALLSHYENGLREPRLEFLIQACDYYGVTADYILGRSERRTYGKELADLAAGLRELSRQADKLLDGGKSE